MQIENRSSSQSSTSARTTSSRISDFSTRVSIGRLAAVCGAVLLATASATQASNPERTVELSHQIVVRALTSAQPVVSQELLEDTRCLAIFPQIRHAAIGLGGRRGLGAVSCRNRRGEWSPPAFLRLTSGTIGLQLGFQTTELLVFFLNDRAKESLIEPQLALGGDVHVAGGSTSRSAGVSTDKRLKQDIYLFENSSGVFAGAAVGGSHTSVAYGAIERYHGEGVVAKQILFDHQIPELRAETRELMNALNQLPYRAPDIEIIEESVPATPPR